MAYQEDETGSTAMLYISRHGDRALPMIEQEISASTARGDWDRVKIWCRVRMRAARMLLQQERSGKGMWRSVYPIRSTPVRLPWSKGGGHLPYPDPSAA